jgi:hypothetical protein
LAGRGCDAVARAACAAVAAARRAAGHAATCVHIAPDVEARATEAAPLVELLIASGAADGVLLADEAAGASAPGPSLRTRLDEAPPAARRALLADHVQREVEAVLGIVPPARAPIGQGFFDLGMDSLMAVELKNRLQRALARPLLPTLVFDHPSIDALTAHLASELLGEASAAAAPSRPPAYDATLVAEVATLSDEQLATVIDDELARLLSPSSLGSRT